MEVWKSDGSEEVVLATNSGLACRFNEEEVRPMGRDTRGVRGMTVGLHDRVISMAIVRSDDLLLSVTENGFGKVTLVSDYRLTHRGGKGVITIKTTKRNGEVVSVRKVGQDDQIMVLSSTGKFIRMKVAEIRQTGRNAQGVKLMDLKEGERIIAVYPVNP